MTTATVRSIDDLAQFLGYRGVVGTGQYPRIVRDIAAADEATARHPAGTRAPLTLRAIREARRRLMLAESAWTRLADHPGEQIDLNDPAQKGRAFRRAAASADIRELQPLLRALEARRIALGIPRFMSDLSVAIVNESIPARADEAADAAALRNEQAVLQAAADVVDPGTAMLVQNNGHRGIVGRNTYEWITTRKPTHAEVSEAQSYCGKHPMGYGGPWDIQHHPHDGGRVKTTWTSSASCD